MEEILKCVGSKKEKIEGGFTKGPEVSRRPIAAHIGSSHKAKGVGSQAGPSISKRVGPHRRNQEGNMGRWARSHPMGKPKEHGPQPRTQPRWKEGLRAPSSSGNSVPPPNITP